MSFDASNGKPRIIIFLSEWGTGLEGGAGVVELLPTPQVASQATLFACRQAKFLLTTAPRMRTSASNRLQRRQRAIELHESIALRRTTRLVVHDHAIHQRAKGLEGPLQLIARCSGWDVAHKQVPTVVLPVRRPHYRIIQTPVVFHAKGCLHHVMTTSR